MCPLTKTACAIVPGAAEDVHIYNRCAVSYGLHTHARFAARFMDAI